jgi:predicted RNase H-like nuclease
VTTQVVGTDGFRGEWVSVALDGGRFLEASTSTTLEGVLGANPHDQVIAADIPIGLAPTGRRLADVEARRFVRGRGSSVFPAPRARGGGLV